MTPEEFVKQREILSSEMNEIEREIDYLEGCIGELELELDDLYREYIDGKNE